MNSKIDLTKTYFNLDIINKFESFEELPASKPLLLANKNGEILFANASLMKKHNIGEGDNLFHLSTEPNLESLFENLIKGGLHTFGCDIIIKIDDDIFESYLLNIERVDIKNEDIFIVYIDSQDNKTKLNKKVNTYSYALESVNVGVMIADIDAKVKYLSTSFEKILNIKLEKAFNKTIINAFKKHLSEIELNELSLSILQQNKWVKVVSDISNEGDVHYKEFRLNFIQNGVNKAESYIITANDITEYIKQTRLLKKSEQRQKSIINNISDPILILRRENKELIFDNANDSFNKSIMDNNKVSKKNKLDENLPKNFYNKIETAVTHLEEKDRIHSQFHYNSPIHEKKYVGKVTYTDDHYDNTRLFIINMTDITEQFEIEKKLREAYKKEISLNKLKSTFLANMSHEIRTPLNAIVGYSDLLEDDVKQMNYESSTQMTTFLKEGVNRLLKLVDNIVEVSLLESGNEDIKLETFDLNEIINSNKKLWIEQAKTKKLRMSFDLYSQSINVKVNKEKLEKAVTEIMDNAIKYNIENGSVKVSTFMESDRMSLQISDTGIGIERESLTKIFKIFSQVEETGYTRKYEGAGLGLSLAKKLISFMNGKLNILSKPNEGTVITISFPQE